MKNPTSNKMSSSQIQTPVKKEMSAPGSPQKIPPASAKVPAKSEAIQGTEHQKQSSSASAQKMTPDTHRSSGSPKPDQANQTGGKQSSATAAPKQESGSLFGSGGAKTEAAKPQESVTGKMFGFGSSIFSSASTLIASAVQDEPKTTPPVSPKMQNTKDTKSPSKPQQSLQTKLPTAIQPKAEKAPSEPPKQASACPVISKGGPSTCPLCKLEINVGSKDPPNYHTCTECKNTVCNQCGFNPMPNVKEWLCLNCQMQRALGVSEPPGTPQMKPQSSPNKVTTPANTLKKETPPTDKAQKKETPTPTKIKEASAPGSPQRKAQQQTMGEVMKGPEIQKQVSPAFGQKTPRVDQKTGPQKPSEETGQAGRKQSHSMSAPAQVSPKLSAVPKSSPKTTPSVSPNMSPAREPKTVAQKPEQEKKPEEIHLTKEDKTPSQPPKTATVSQKLPNSGQSTCPLCKDELNIDPKDPPNYNTCTECKTTVCNQCGFTPMPIGEVSGGHQCLQGQMFFP
uniref:Zinc finger piccolo-type domain-containing protein n=1 Tax=Echeneis naucrates TaxID=173247 RepID=A0A665V3Q6_ECHNA